jgi:hypothetical protein
VSTEFQAQGAWQARLAACNATSVAVLACHSCICLRAGWREGLTVLCMLVPSLLSRVFGTPMQQYVGTTTGDYEQVKCDLQGHDGMLCLPRVGSNDLRVRTCMYTCAFSHLRMLEGGNCRTDSHCQSCRA